MLRSLINDPDDKRDGQPKPDEAFDEGEKHYKSVAAPARERELQRDRALRARTVFLEDIRACVEQDIVTEKAIAKKLGVSEIKARMGLKELRLID